MNTPWLRCGASWCGELHRERVPSVDEPSPRRRERERTVMRADEREMAFGDLVIERWFAPWRWAHSYPVARIGRRDRIGDRGGHGVFSLVDVRSGGACRTWPGWMTEGSGPIARSFAAYQRGHASAISASEQSGPSRCAAINHRESPGLTSTSAPSVDGSGAGMAA